MAEVLLPCTRFAVRLRPSTNPGEPTNLEKAVLFFLRSRRGKGADVEDIREFTNLGAAIVTDMLVDFANRRWIVLNTDRTVTISDSASKKLDSPAGLQELGSTDTGKRMIFCYDLVGGDFTLIERRYLMKNATGNNALPRTVKATGDALSEFGYRFPLDGFTPKYMDRTTFKDKVFRAIDKNLWARENLKDLDPRASSVDLIPLNRPSSFSEDLFQYRVAYDIVSSKDNPEIFSLAPSRTIIGPSEKRLAQKNVDVIPEIARAGADLGDPNFLGYLMSSKKTTSVGAGVPEIASRRLIEIFDAAFDPSDLNNAGEYWIDAKEDFLDTLSNGLDLGESCVIETSSGWDSLASLVSKAEQRLLIVSPIASETSKALRTEKGSLLEATADVITNNPNVCLVVNTLKSDRGVDARNTIATRLGSPRLVESDRRLLHLSTPIMAQDANMFIFSTESFFDTRTPSGLVLRSKGHEGRDSVTDGGSATIHSFVENLPEELQRKLSAECDRTFPEGTPIKPRSRPAQVRTLIKEIDGKFDANNAFFEDKDAREELRKQLQWLNDWALEHSESFKILVGADISTHASQIISETAPAQPLIIVATGKADAENIDILPKELRSRANRQTDKGGWEKCAPGKTVVAFPAGGGDKPSVFAHVRNILASDFSADKNSELLSLEPTLSPLGFVANGSAMVIARDSLFGFRPLFLRKNKSLEVGVLLRGKKARELGIEFVTHWFPELASHIPDGENKPLRPPPVGKELAKQIRMRWQGERWVEDGNRGAFRFRALLVDSNDTKGSIFADDPLEARKRFPAPDVKGQLADRQGQEIAYGILKGAALLGSVPVADVSNDARKILAEDWVDEGRYLPGAALADHLPGAHWLKDGLVRKLCVCLTRGIAPNLSADEGDSLGEPSPAVLIWSSLLMLDGLEGNLPEWLIYVEPGLFDGKKRQLAEFTRALAQFRKARPRSIMDLSHVLGDSDEGKLDIVVRDICDRIDAQNRKEKDNKAKSVIALRVELFSIEGSFMAELNRLYRSYDSKSDTGVIKQNKGWDALTEGERVARIRKLLSDQETGDVGANLLESAEAEHATLSPDRLAQAHWARKHEAMVSRTGYAPVRVNLSGGDTLTTTKHVFRDVITELVPLVLGKRSEADSALEAAARELLDIATDDLAASDFPTLDRLIRRIGQIEASENLREPPWVFPLVTNPALQAADWVGIAAKVMEREFSPKRGLGDVVNWYLKQAKQMTADEHEMVSGCVEPLVELLDLLEEIREQVAPGEREDLIALVETEFEEIAKAVRKEVEDYSTFLHHARLEPLSFRETRERIGSTDGKIIEALRDHDLETATLETDEMLKAFYDLRSEFRTLFGAFEKGWEEMHESNDVREVGRSVLRDKKLLKSHLADLPRFLNAYDKYDPKLRSEKIKQNSRFARRFVTGRADPDAGEVRDSAFQMLELISSLIGDETGENIGPRAPKEVIGQVFSFFTSGRPDNLMATAKFEDGFWILETFHQHLDYLTLDPDNGNLRIWIPTTMAAERKVRRGDINGLAPIRGYAIVLAVHFPEAVTAYPALTKSDLALASTMPLKDRKLFLMSLRLRAVRNRDGGLRGWWEAEAKNPAAFACFFRRILLSGRGHVSFDDEDPHLCLGRVPTLLARFSLAFELGTEIDFDKTQRNLSDRRIFELSKILTEFSDELGTQDCDTEISDTQLLKLLTKTAGL